MSVICARGSYSLNELIEWSDVLKNPLIILSPLIPFHSIGIDKCPWHAPSTWSTCTNAPIFKTNAHANVPTNTCSICTTWYLFICSLLQCEHIRVVVDLAANCSPAHVLTTFSSPSIPSQFAHSLFFRLFVTLHKTRILELGPSEDLTQCSNEKRAKTGGL